MATPLSLSTNEYFYTTNYDISNSTVTPRPGFTHDDPKFIILILFCIVISLIAVTCNLFNLIVIYKSPALHNMNNLLIFNLCFVDFLNGSVGLPVSMATMIIGNPAYSFCQIQGFIVVLLYIASLIATTAVSIDRCYAILNPFGYESSINRKKAILTSIAIWMIPFILAALPLFGLEKSGLGKYFLLVVCAISFHNYLESYIVYWMILILILISVSIITLCYIVIFIVAYKISAQDLAHGNLKKSIRTTSLIVGTNMICWFPYLIIGILSVRSIDPNHVPIYRPSISNVISVILIFSNAAINPVIYATTNSYLRKRLCRLLHYDRIQPLM